MNSFFKITFLFFSFYLFLLLIYTYTNNESVKYILYLFAAFFLLFILIFDLLNLKYLDQTIIIYSSSLIILLTINIFLNFEYFSFSFLKFYSMPIMFLCGVIIGKNVNFKFTLNKYLVLWIIFLPLIFHVIAPYIIQNYLDQSIFANRNNAVAFSIVAAYLILLFYRNFYFFILYFLINIIIYHTLGALFASLIAIFIIFFKNIRVYIFPSLLIFITVYSLFSFENLVIFERAKVAINGLKIVLFDYKFDVANISYNTMIFALNSKDLSFLFRLKHWANIIQLFSESTFINILLGHGVGATKAMTFFHKQAHNDYLFMLFDFGFFYFMTFISLIVNIFKKIKLNIISLPFLVFLIYMFSENLIDNFVIISILYYIVGIIYGLFDNGENVNNITNYFSFK